MLPALTSFEQLGVAGYGLAIVAYLCLCAYLRPVRWQWSAPEVRIWVASFTTAVWAGFCVWQAAQARLTTSALYLLDVSQIAFWLWVLLALSQLQAQPGWLQRSLLWVPAFSIAIAIAGSLLAASGEADQVIAAWLALISLTPLLIGILGIEQVYRNSGGTAQRVLRWLCLGVGGMLLANVFLYSETIITQQVDRDFWLLRGLLFTLLALPIYQGLRAMGGDWRIGLFVSRQVVFFSTSFVLVGAYLVLISTVGWALRRWGGEWGAAAQLVFIAAAACILLVLIFSGAIRRRLRVFVAKHFFRNRYDYRIEWLRFVRTLSERSAQDNLNESAIRSVAQIIESDAGALWLLDEHARFYRPAATWTSASAEIGTESPYVPQFDEPLLQFMSRTGWVVDGAELRRQPELYDNASLPSELTRLGADCLVVPLLHVESMYGFLLLRRPLDLPQLNFEDRDLLKTVGRHLAAHLWQADNDRRLAHGREFEAYHRLTAFVMHDLKNLTAQLRLVVQNAEKHKRNPEFVDDAIATIANSVERMGKLLAELQREPSAGATRTVSLADVTQRAALRAGARLPVPAVKIATDASVAADPDRLSMVMDHVLRNAQDATQEDGEISVIVDVREGAPLVAVADTGCGMTEAFVRERLFRPFDTTKGSRGMGIGAYQVREYLRSLGGEVLVKSSAGSGTTFTLVFPRQSVSVSAHA